MQTPPLTPLGAACRAAEQAGRGDVAALVRIVFHRDRCCPVSLEYGCHAVEEYYATRGLLVTPYVVETCLRQTDQTTERVNQ